MSASKQAKRLGAKSLAEVSRNLGKSATGNPKVSVTTLRNWYYNKPMLFDAVVIGVTFKL